MDYELRPTLSACNVDGHFVFLDVHADRYFHMTPYLERAFERYAGGDIRNEADIQALLERGILVHSHPTRRSIVRRSLPAPARSVVEMPGDAGILSPLTLIEIALLVLSTRWLLAHRKLHEVLDAVQQARLEIEASVNPSAVNEAVLLKAARMFRRERLLVPIEPRCLLDSISLVRFLARRNLPSNIVFGVTGDPFSAHCWVQDGTLVLNDTIGNVQSHQPIRVV